MRGLKKKVKKMIQIEAEDWFEDNPEQGVRCVGANIITDKAIKFFGGG